MSLIIARSQIYNLLKNVRCFSLSKSRLDNVVVYELHGVDKKSESSKQSASPTVAEAPGLSSRVVSFGNEPVGSGALKDGDYKNPEYFSYHELSYYEAEIEMAKYRLPQPISRK